MAIGFSFFKELLLSNLNSNPELTDTPLHYTFSRHRKHSDEASVIRNIPMH